MQLPHLFNSIGLKNEQRVRMGVNPTCFKCGDPNPDLPNLKVLISMRTLFSNLTVVKNANYENSCWVKNFPSILLIVLGAQAVNYGPRSDPLVTVFGYTIRI
uniref:Uncharacterized protein n=1 Tax=Opuntia streptacantha TaxID=393608 RepID=A0A7C8YIE3_OPUST